MSDYLSIAVKYPLDATSYLVILLPISIGGLQYRYLSKASKLFWLYFICVFVKESIALYTSVHAIHNLYLQNIQSFIDIVFLGLAYYYGLNEIKLRRYLLGLAVSCLVGSTVFFEVNAISPVNQIAGRLFCISIALLFFNDMLKTLYATHLALYSMFWLSSGLLIYGTGTCLIALFGQLLVSTSIPDSISDFFWNTQQIIYVVFCLFASIGFRVSRYRK